MCVHVMSVTVTASLHHQEIGASSGHLSYDSVQAALKVEMRLKLYLNRTNLGNMNPIDCQVNPMFRLLLRLNSNSKFTQEPVSKEWSGTPIMSSQWTQCNLGKAAKSS